MRVQGSSSLKATISSKASSKPIIHIPRSSIYPLGVSASSKKPLFNDVSWTIQPDDAWAVVSPQSNNAKTSLLEALTGHLRISPSPPPPGGLFPFLEGRDPHKLVSLVSFAHRPRTAGGGFYDYTARYGAVREEDKRTLRDIFFPKTARPLHELAIPSIHTHSDPLKEHGGLAKETERRKLFERLTEKLGLTQFLDLPMIALSNGQTRKARMVKALLDQPELLILDEPLTGLDVSTRYLVLSLLQALHVNQSPHVILGVRPQDPIPDWTTHLALIHKDGTINTGRKEDVLQAESGTLHHGWQAKSVSETKYRDDTSPPVVRLADVSVTYGDRKVLKNINWTIRANSRWHLLGLNGAGKTTLLAMVTGDHPQSYTQSTKLTLFNRPRAKWPTPHLSSRIGRVSPEMHNAFPRRQGMTVWDAVGTGFEGGFVPRGQCRVGFGHDGREMQEGSEEEAWRLQRMQQVLEALGPASWKGDADQDGQEAKIFAQRAFADLASGEQSMVLLMRALVGQPPLVLLDEAWAGMDEGMVGAARAYLREGGGLVNGQACIVVSHWDDEVPWRPEDGVRKFILENGSGREE